MPAGDRAWQDEARRSMLRVAARLTRPQLGQELVHLLGLQSLPPLPGGGGCKALWDDTSVGGPGASQAPSPGAGTGGGGPGAQRPAAGLWGDQEMQCDRDGVWPSTPEVEEAAFQLVKELAAGAGAVSKGGCGQKQRRYVGVP